MSEVAPARQVTLGDLYVAVPAIPDLGGWKEDLRDTVAWETERWNMLESNGTGIVETGPFIAVTRRRYVVGMEPIDQESDIFRMADDQHARMVFAGASSRYETLMVCDRKVWTQRSNAWISLAFSYPEESGESAVFAIDTMFEKAIEPEFLAELFNTALSSLSDPESGLLFPCDVQSEMPTADYWTTERTEPDHG